MICLNCFCLFFFQEWGWFRSPYDDSVVSSSKAIAKKVFSAQWCQIYGLQMILFISVQTYMGPEIYICKHTCTRYSPYDLQRLDVSSKIVYRFMGIILNFKRSIWKVSDTCINHNYRNQRKRLSQIILADSFYSLYYRQSWCFSACKYWAVLVCYCLNAPLEISFLRWRTRLQYFFSLWCQSCW